MCIIRYADITYDEGNFGTKNQLTVTNKMHGYNPISRTHGVRSSVVPYSGSPGRSRPCSKQHETDKCNFKFHSKISHHGGATDLPQPRNSPNCIEVGVVDHLHKTAKAGSCH